MDKITYLAELAEGLARWVPERERRDILRYYAEYFEEAGPEREAEVVAELGDPWALSCRLAVEGGYVTPERAASWTPRKRWPKVLLGTAVGLVIFSLVSVFGLLAFNAIRTVSSGFTLGATVFTENVEGMWGLAPVEDNITYVEDGELTDFYFAGDGSLEAFDSIDADISLGNIQVLAGDDYTLSIRRSEALWDYELTWEVKNGVFRLMDNNRSYWGRVGNWGKWVVEVIITVPENAALDIINLKTGVGDVLLHGLNAETVTAETGVGKAECYEARNVRKLSLDTGVGDVNLMLEGVRPGLDIKLESGTGDVEASLGCSENDCGYGLESGTGAVTVNGVNRGSEAKRRDSASCKLYAESGTGDVSVYFTLG